MRKRIRELERRNRAGADARTSSRDRRGVRTRPPSSRPCWEEPGAWEHRQPRSHPRAPRVPPQRPSHVQPVLRTSGKTLSPAGDPGGQDTEVRKDVRFHHTAAVFRGPSQRMGNTQTGKREAPAQRPGLAGRHRRRDLGEDSVGESGTSQKREGALRVAANSVFNANSTFLSDRKGDLIHVGLPPPSLVRLPRKRPARTQL